MRLKLLCLVAILALSCQENSPKVKDSVSDEVEVSNSITKEEYNLESKQLAMMIEKVFMKESENKNRAKMISNFFQKSRLPEQDKIDILNKVMLKIDLSTEDRKEITLPLKRFQRINTK